MTSALQDKIAFSISIYSNVTSILFYSIFIQVRVIVQNLIPPLVT